MKRYIFLLILFCAIISTASAQKKFAVYAVGFYNQENLFDTCHDEGKNDYEYLPNGSYHWNGMKYTHKLKNMARVLADMGTDQLPNIGCAIIGLSEVENDNVMRDLCSQEPLKARNYQYVHIEGPDQRGIDCALIYNPQLFEVTDAHLYPYVYELPEDSAHATRGFLTVKGKLAGEEIAVIVCHWPSRGAGSYYRELAGKQVRVIKDNLLAENPNLKIMIMGDMNDDPVNKSMTTALGAHANIEDVEVGGLYNPWYNILVKKGVGTLTYNGGWNLFDQIVMTSNMLNKKDAKDFSTLKYFRPEIFRRDYMMQTEGKYKGGPKRTTSSGVWQDGFSDHLPVLVYLVKEVQ